MDYTDKPCNDDFKMNIFSGISVSSVLKNKNMSTVSIHNRDAVFDPAMQGPLAVSAGLHVLVFLLAMFGLPFIAIDPDVLSNPVSVEIVNIDEITQTNKAPAPKKSAPDKPKPSPQMTEETPPDLTKPDPVKLSPDDFQEPEAVPLPDDTQENAPKEEELKPPVKPKPKAKPTPPEKAKENDFQSLLKNLMPDEEDAKQSEEQPQNVEASPNVLLSDRLSISELDAFKSQIEPCWNVPAGAKFAEDLLVEIRVFMNPDASVQKASILDMSRYNRDSHFRAAADSAMRALRNPRCTPLKLPLEKYDQWKTIVIRFDPRDML